MQIIVADHHSEARKALVAFLRDQLGYTVIGEASEADSLIKLALKKPAHVILLDYELPGPALVEIIDQLHSAGKSSNVIVMSSDLEHARIALNVKADGFISKGDQPEWLLLMLQKYEEKQEGEPG